MYHIVRESDSPVRSGSFGSNAENSSISVRGHADDLPKYLDAIEHKRRSLEVPINAKYGSSPALSTLEQDSARSPNTSFSPPAPSAHARVRPHSSDLYSRTRPLSSGTSTPTYESFPSEGRRSRSNTGPSEEVLMQTARTLAEVGDDINREYGSELNVSIQNFRHRETIPSLLSDEEWCPFFFKTGINSIKKTHLFISYRFRLSFFCR